MAQRKHPHLTPAEIDKAISVDNLLYELLSKLYSIEGLAQVMQEAHGGEPFTGGDSPIPYSTLCLLESLSQDAQKIIDADIRPRLVTAP